MGGGVGIGRGKSLCLPPHPPSQEKSLLTQRWKRSFTNVFFSSFSLSFPLSLRKHLRGTCGVSSPMLVWASKDQQDADLDSSQLKFIYEKPAWVPSLEILIFQGCTCNSWHQNPACDQGRGSWGGLRPWGLRWRRGSALGRGGPGMSEQDTGAAWHPWEQQCLLEWMQERTHMVLLTWKHWSFEALKPRLSHILW